MALFYRIILWAWALLGSTEAPKNLPKPVFRGHTRLREGVALRHDACTLPPLEGVRMAFDRTSMSCHDIDVYGADERRTSRSEQLV
jgi:hypothetical protein